MCAVLLSASASVSHAAPPDAPRWTIGISTWFSEGESSWSHDASGGDPRLGNPTSTLAYTGLESIVVELALDVREGHEFDALYIPGSISVPRGILESACDWDYDETVPELAAGHEREIIVICRSGNRSILAAHTMLRMGFKNVASLKTGIRGWNDFEQPLMDVAGKEVDIDDADEIMASKLRDDQRRPAI